ncbi:MAG: helix-turn-helix domain-containing protein [Mariniblastus sp.]
MVSETIGVSKPIILLWISQRKLKASNIGGGKIRPRWRIARNDITEFLESRSNLKTASPKQRKPETAFF